MSLAEFFILILTINVFLLSSIWFLERKTCETNRLILLSPIILVVLAWCAFLFSVVFDDQEIRLRQILSSILVSLWGGYLTIYLYSTKNIFHRKELFLKFDGSYKKEVILLTLFQMLLIFPIISINFLPGTSGLNFLDFLGLILFCAGLACQVKSNNQLVLFTQTNNIQQQILDTGLWGISRHPNYLGILIQWWAIYLIACSSMGGYWSIFGPLFLTFFMYSLAKKGEAKLLKEKEGYAEYLKSTNRFIPDILALIHLILPHRLLTIILGMLSNVEVKLVKNLLISFFCFIYKPNLEESKYKSKKDYLNFNSFFTRALDADVRPIDSSSDSITSPVDGNILDYGKISEGKLIQAKKFRYDVHELIQDKKISESIVDGSFITLYLAPRNYHRIHSPLPGIIDKTQHISGSLYGVNKSSQKLIPSLYSKNERTWIVIKSQKTYCVVVCVGASVVGSIVPFWLQKDKKDNPDIIASWKKGPKENQKKIHKGQELAFFQIGSTVILLFYKNFNFNNNFLSENKSVKFGERLI